MKTYNDTTYVLLGILTTDCKSGYAIKQFIDQSLQHFWKISYGQIYPTLKLLVEEGLAEVQKASEGRKEKQEYHLTAKGYETLQNWLEQPITQLPVERNEFLLKLFFGRYQSDEQTVSLLQNYKHGLEERYQTYEAIEQAIIRHNAHDENAMYWLFTLDYGKRLTKAAIEWCLSTVDKFSTKEEE